MEVSYPKETLSCLQRLLERTPFMHYMQPQATGSHFIGPTVLNLEKPCCWKEACPASLHSSVWRKGYRNQVHVSAGPTIPHSTLQIAYSEAPPAEAHVHESLIHITYPLLSWREGEEWDAYSYHTMSGVPPSQVMLLCNGEEEPMPQQWGSVTWWFFSRISLGRFTIFQLP